MTGEVLKLLKRRPTTYKSNHADLPSSRLAFTSEVGFAYKPMGLCHIRRGCYAHARAQSIIDGVSGDYKMTPHDMLFALVLLVVMLTLLLR